MATTSILLSLLVSVIYALMIWPVMSHTDVAIWLATAALVSLVRLIFVRRYIKQMPRIGQKRWERGFIVLAGAAALVWGAAAILFFPPDQPLYQLVTFTMLGGVATSAAWTQAASPNCYRIYILGIMIPIFVRLISIGSTLYFAMAFLNLLFISIMILVSQWVYEKLRETHLIKTNERYRIDVMEKMAKGVQLEDILDTIVAGVEEQADGTVCSICLLDKSSRQIIVTSAPSLPDFYNDAVNGLLIGPDVGSCGAAMYTGQRVVTEDIKSHPNWTPFRETALRAGLQSCWSEPIKSSDGSVLGSFAIYRNEPSQPDQEDIRRIEIAANLAGLAIERHALVGDHEIAAMVYRNSSEAMVVTDVDEQVLAVNEAFAFITGYTHEEMVGRQMNFSARNAADIQDYAKMMESVFATGKWQGELWNYRKNGERFAARVTVNSINDEQGSLSRRVILISDITEQKRSDELIWRQANYDSLTGLPNRRLFRDRLEQETKRAQRSGLPMALLFLDLDNFKTVNDTLGHDAGDELLVEAAKRIADCIRDSDTIARLGGDEFTAILAQLEDVTIVERVTNKMLEQLRLPFQIAAKHVCISVSIGITLYPTDAADVEELLKNADIAMYAAKNAGRNRFCYYTPATTGQVDA